MTNYLRATGPNIHLTVEDILARIQRSGSSSSSSDSGVVTSDRNAYLIIPTFIMEVYQKLPNEGFLPFADVGRVQEWKEDVQKAIVPIVLVMDSVLIRLWVFLFGDRVVGQLHPPLGPISIPVQISKKLGSKTPLVDTMVHRSPCLNPQASKGF
jgi:hypothetical protein